MSRFPHPALAITAAALLTTTLAATHSSAHSHLPTHTTMGAADWRAGTAEGPAVVRVKINPRSNAFGDRGRHLVERFGQLTPTFLQPATQLEQWRRTGVRSGTTLPDLTQWYDVALRPGLSPAQVIPQLKALPEVVHAYQPPQLINQAIVGDDTPKDRAAFAATPDFTPKQGYRKAGDGIDADYANAQPGGDGAGIRVHNIEMGWDRNHEDLATLARPEAFVQFSDNPQFAYTAHGTATSGIDIATKDAKGITGIVYAAEGQFTNMLYGKLESNMAGAIGTALTRLRPGDVITIQIAVHGCDNSVPGGADAAVEYEPATYDAVRTAVAQGVHVVLSAGNGKQNYDHPCYAEAMPPALPDSGAIFAGGGGAGTAQGEKCHPARTPLVFTNYGKRVNLQGWGQCVVTTGLGDLQGGDVNQRYTAQFGGTSAAAPIVGGAVAAVTGYAKAHGKYVTPAAMRELLMRTGTPQPDGDPRKIGPAPNLRAALDALPTVWSDAP